QLLGERQEDLDVAQLHPTVVEVVNPWRNHRYGIGRCSRGRQARVWKCPARGAGRDREETTMAVVRTHRYTVETGRFAQMLEQRGTLIQGLRAAHPAFSAATLVRLEDGSCLDIWRWEAADAMRVAAQAPRDVPLAGATLGLTTGRETLDGEVPDERSTRLNSSHVKI